MSTCHVCFLYLLMIVFCNLGIHSASSDKSSYSFHGDNNQSATMESEHANSTHKKLLSQGSCTSRDIHIIQGKESTHGIPLYIVQILSTCVCVSEIHVHCGWFASATRFIDPTIFKRLSYDDCLVNGGKPLNSGQVIQFTYSNTFMYPLEFKSAKFC